MSEPTTSEPKAVQINLREMNLKYLGAIQQSFDLAACTVGALRAQTERDYDEFSRSVRFMPSQQHHLGFDAVRPVAENWLLRQLLGEALGLLVPFLEDTRSVAALAKFKAEGGTDQQKLQKILGEDRQAFLRLSLEDRIKLLKEGYSISAPMDSFVSGYVKLAQVLARGGTVAEADVTDEKDLVVRLTVIELQPAAAGEAQQGTVTGRLLEGQKRFAVGSKVELRKEEVLSLFVSVAVFISSIMGALQAFVQKTLPAEQTTPETRSN